MRLEELDYVLPPDLIAQQPLAERDCSRLLVLDRSTDGLSHRHFRELPNLLRPGDLLVVNDSRVFAARLQGAKSDTGGRAECLLLREVDVGLWQALLRPGRRLRSGSRLTFGDLEAVLVERLGGGVWTVRFEQPDDLVAQIASIGHVPLPPYIHQRLDDAERYQTVYARQTGSSAAPTAGLHFTPRLLEDLEAKGIERVSVTLHVGLDTFRPVSEAVVEQHKIHREAWTVTPEAAAKLLAAKQAGRRLVAVGTTVVRTIETLAARDWASGSGLTDLFITPGYVFRAVDALLTNFHLPRTTLLALVGAFAGQERMAAAYAVAIERRYRMLSFGDAMLIL